MLREIDTMAMVADKFPSSLRLRVGEWVEVRTPEEILSTLDGNARLDELPFMPQMLQYCGRRFQVRKRAHKLCDTANSTGARRMSDSVFLEDLRCDGVAYGGCEMRCLIFWKESWLRRVEDPPGSDAIGAGSGRRPVRDYSSRCSEKDVVVAGTRAPAPAGPESAPVYVCQATQLPRATRPLSRWDIRQYFEDYASGNARAAEVLSGLLFIVYENLVSSGLGFGSALRWMYDAFQRLRRRSPYPSRLGKLPSNSPTPSANLGLQVGELVRVKEHAAILETVDEQLRNRGMSFHGEMVPFCGRTFRVRQRARKIMNERTGQLMVLKNECLVLDGADCLGRYTNPLLCPRSCYPYWREIWLERVETQPAFAHTQVSQLEPRDRR